MSFITPVREDVVYDERSKRYKELWKKFSIDAQPLVYNRYGNITVINDDSILGGTKGRFLYNLLPEGYKEYVCVSAWCGSDQVTLGAIVKQMRIRNNDKSIKAVVFTHMYDPKYMADFPYIKMANNDYDVEYHLQSRKKNTLEEAYKYCQVSNQQIFFFCGCQHLN